MLQTKTLLIEKNFSIKSPFTLTFFLYAFFSCSYLEENHKIKLDSLYIPTSKTHSDVKLTQEGGFFFEAEIMHRYNLRNRFGSSVNENHCDRIILENLFKATLCLYSKQDKKFLDFIKNANNSKYIDLIIAVKDYALELRPNFVKELLDTKRFTIFRNSSYEYFFQTYLEEEYIAYKAQQSRIRVYTELSNNDLQETSSFFKENVIASTEAFDTSRRIFESPQKIKKLVEEEREYYRARDRAKQSVEKRLNSKIKCNSMQKLTICNLSPKPPTEPTNRREETHEIRKKELARYDIFADQQLYTTPPCKVSIENKKNSIGLNSSQKNHETNRTRNKIFSLMNSKITHIPTLPIDRNISETNKKIVQLKNTNKKVIFEAPHI